MSITPSTDASFEHGVRLRLSYDGTDFAGFQTQVGRRTVQQTLAQAAAQITRHPVAIRGASRTDAGVHAEGQVAAFSTCRALPPERWILALNRYLPPDISVWEAAPCAADYDPRFDAVDKTYRYLFHLRVARDALLRERAWHLGRYVRHAPAAAERVSLDLDAMRDAAARLRGTHDFRAFRASGDLREDTSRTLSRIELLEDYTGRPHLLALEVRGTAFMKNMVRILAGTLVDVGRGVIAPRRVSALLGPEGDRSRAGITAPPQGLSLVAVTLGRSGDPASR